MPWPHRPAEASRRGRPLVSELGSRIRRPVFRRHDLRVRAARQRARPDPQEPGRSRSYGGITEFLATQLFGNWDVVLQHDLSQGLRCAAGRRWRAAAAHGRPPERPDRRAQVLAARPRHDPRAPRQAHPEHPDGGRPGQADQPGNHPRLRAVPGPLGRAEPDGRPPRARGWCGCLSWAQNPYIKRHNIAFCLLCDRLAEINERLIGSAHVATLEVAMPDAAAREEFATWYDGQDGKLGNLTDFPPKQLAELTAGLNLVNIERLLARAAQSGQKLDAQALKRLKKGLIERQARGLVEFVEPPHTLDDFVGNDAVKHRLVDDAALLAKGRLDAAPMGYLICGPVGTGKTYLAECFAGSVGIPCVKLRNFRSKYVGETEGNLEQILNVLRAMGPVVVVIDEADAALGNREAGGDSGTSSRVFSMIASQMGDTRYRGKLLWMLLTSRPDLLPIDLKRQGRAEVHLPLFAPATTPRSTS